MKGTFLLSAGWPLLRSHQVGKTRWENRKRDGNKKMERKSLIWRPSKLSKKEFCGTKAPLISCMVQRKRIVAKYGWVNEKKWDTWVRNKGPRFLNAEEDNLEREKRWWELEKIGYEKIWWQSIYKRPKQKVVSCDNNLNLSCTRIPIKPCLFLLLALQPFVA